MAFDNRLGQNIPIRSSSSNVNSREGNLVLPDILAQNPQTPQATRVRQLIRWRIPGKGYIDMYLNPQQLVITEKKVITKQRTKGGYVIQYWGEELTSVKINGSTGASGIEGINVLRDIYRAEQNAFHKVEQTLADRLNSMMGTSLGSFARNVTQQGLGSALGSLVSDVLGGSSNPPVLPTLGSLAVSVEMFYQGWVFKGFFEDFTITESVSNGVGVFMYDMSFTVTDRRGDRSNFMPWHRQVINGSGFNKADTDVTPLNFGGEV